jgi:hypothetical protein
VIGDRDFSTRRRRRAGSAVDLALLAGGVIAMAGSGAAAGSAWADLRHARASLDETRRATAEAEGKARALAGEGGAAGLLGARAIWTLEAPPPRVVAAVAQAMPDDVRLDSLALRYGTELEVDMSVVARSAAAYDAFLEGLAKSGSFSSVAPGNESRDRLVRASVRARYRRSDP